MNQPCPFCGAEMAAKYDGLQHPYKPRAEAGETVCYMNGTYLGKDRVAGWNRRAAGGDLRVEIIDGLPRFGNVGRPADLTLVNATIEYLAGKQSR